MSLLSTRDLSRHFGGLKAVEGVDFDLPTGQVRALIGPNGAGKTTFVGMLAGRVEASRGQIFLKGEDITRKPAHQRIRSGIAYTCQITSIFGRLSVAENIRLAINGQARGDTAMTGQRVLEGLERVGLSGRADQPAGTLSYGHQRLLEIGMGISQQPSLLILDEPTQGLADAEIDDFITLVRALAGQMTILLIEHNIRVVREAADRITVLDQGQVLAEGTPDEIHANAAVQAAYLGQG